MPPRNWALQDRPDAAPGIAPGLAVASEVGLQAVGAGLVEGECPAESGDDADNVGHIHEADIVGMQQ